MGGTHPEYYHGMYIELRGNHLLKYFCLPAGREDETRELTALAQRNLIDLILYGCGQFSIVSYEDVSGIWTRR